MKRAPRIRASLACESCQKRKVKCDAQKNSTGSKCTPCRQMNLFCSVDPAGDRRKSGSRRHVETLEKRILDLEKLLQQPTQKPPQSGFTSEDGLDSRSNPATVLTTPGLRITPGASPYALQQLAGDVDASRDRVSSLENNDTAMISNAASYARVGENNREIGLGAGRRTPQNYTQLTATAQLCQSCPSTDEPADLGIAIVTDTVQVKCRLLQSFFRDQPLWVNAVDEELFWRHRESRKQSMWYSSFLENAMLASATRLSSSRNVRVLGDQYAAQAKAGIVLALNHPSAASVQGLLMLSEYEVSQDRESLGWNTCGMACRMMIELGLHKSLDTSEGGETVETTSARFHLLGACIALEGVWCVYMGRPSSLPRRLLQTATISYKQYQGPSSATLAAWMGLSGHMADICEILNSSHPLSPEAKSLLSQLNVHLRDWMKALPSGFVYDEPNIADLHPAAYALQMQYCKLQILVYQACYADSNAAEAQCGRSYDAARRIIRLLLIYRQIHGTERIRSVMLDTLTPALEILVQEYLRYPDLIRTQRREINWLRLAIESIADMQVHFPITGRTLRSLAMTVEGTPLAPLFGVVAAYPSRPSLLSTPTETDMEQTNTMHGVLEDQSMLPEQFMAGGMDELNSFLFSWADLPPGSVWTLTPEEGLITT